MTQQIVLGLGPGHCGLNLLREILTRQPRSTVTLEDLPLLPWKTSLAAGAITERLLRWKSDRRDELIGDVATFYLPYISEAFAADATVKAICLRRPHEEIRRAFIRHLAGQYAFPVNHWTSSPPEGTHHDPLWTPTFPQYPDLDVETCLTRYLRDYDAEADRLAQEHPDRFLVCDTELLTHEAGVQSVLDFLGLPANQRNVITGKRPAEDDSRPPAPPVPADSLDPKTCVVLVPFHTYIHAECEDGLRELEERGYTVRRLGGCAAIDQARNALATEALVNGYRETMWIDSDIGFRAEDVERLRRRPEPIVCGMYPKKGQRAIACHAIPGTNTIQFGAGGGLVELLYAATGFLLVRRNVYERIQQQLELPVCNQEGSEPTIPFFQPFVRRHRDGAWYLAEDYAFCERARQCGFRIYGDSSIRLWHVGTYRYGWEDAGMERARYDTLTLTLTSELKSAAESASRPADPLEVLRSEHPWPAARPEAPEPPERNWLFPSVRQALRETVPADASLILEVGSWLGRSARYLSELAPQATILCVDTWQGSAEHHDDPELQALLPRLYETFLAGMWDLRGRLVPIRSDSVAGMTKIARLGCKPQVVYLDADHSYEAVVRDVNAALDLFPDAVLIGDDWDWEGVRRGVTEVVKARRRTVQVMQVAWRIK